MFPKNFSKIQTFQLVSRIALELGILIEIFTLLVEKKIIIKMKITRKTGKTFNGNFKFIQKKKQVKDAFYYVIFSFIKTILCRKFSYFFSIFQKIFFQKDKTIFISNKCLLKQKTKNKLTIKIFLFFFQKNKNNLKENYLE